MNVQEDLRLADQTREVKRKIKGNIPGLDPTLRLQLYQYQQKLFRLPYTPQISRLVDCCQVILEETA